MRRLPTPFPRKMHRPLDHWAKEGGYLLRHDHVERVIRPATAQVLDIFLDVVDRACRDQEIMDSLGLPPQWRDDLAASRRNQPDFLAMRFDFALDVRGCPKLLECNAENPGDLPASAAHQESWLRFGQEQGTLPQDTAQFNHLDQALHEWFRARRHLGLVGFVCQDDNAEDLSELEYLQDCAIRAGCATCRLSLPLSDAPLPPLVIKRVRWHSLARQGQIRRLQGRADAPCVMDPFWTVMMGSKAVLAWAWHFHPGHPHLLPAWLDGQAPSPLPSRHVIKPRISLRGHNVRIVSDDLPGGGSQTFGPFADSSGVVQAYQPLPRTRRADGHEVWAVLGSWVIAGQPAGIAVFEDTSPIQMADSHAFVPHFMRPRPKRPTVAALKGPVPCVCP